MDRSESVLSDSAASCVQLPPELWIVVLSQIRPNPGSTERDHVIARLGVNQCKSHGDEVLQNVSLTCRSLRDLALPIRFRHVELHAEGTEESRPRELYIRLLTSETLRNFVKVVSLWVYGRGLPHLPESTRDILCGMRNLEDLQIQIPFQMTTSLYSHICALPSLHRLQVAIPSQDAWDSDNISGVDFDQPNIYSLSVLYRDTEIAYQVPKPSGWPLTPPRPLPPPWLASIALSSSIRHLQLPVYAITLPSIGLNSRTIATSSPHLITLEVPAPSTMLEWEEFWQFTSLSPLITTIILNPRVWDHSHTVPNLPLPSNFLPALRRFQGPLCCAKLVVPGRSVNAIVLTSLHWMVSLDRLRPLTLSTANILSLDIREPNILELVAMIAEAFPNLEELYMSVSTHVDLAKSQKWFQRGFALDIGRLTQLRTLKIAFHHTITASQEKEALSRLSHDHPLERVRFSSCCYDRTCACPVGLWRKCLGVWMKS